MSMDFYEKNVKKIIFFKGYMNYKYKTKYKIRQKSARNSAYPAYLSLAEIPIVFSYRKIRTILGP